MIAPSVKTLERFFEKDVSRVLRGLMKCETDPMDFQSVQKWVNQCYHKPSETELIMEAINEVLGGFGVETIKGRCIDKFYGCSQASYVNMGDSYEHTILHDHELDRFVVTTVGDWVESKTKERQLV